MEREGAGTSISQAPCWPPRSVTLLFTECAVPREAALSSAGPGRRSHGERVLGECLPLKTAVGSPETHAHRAPRHQEGVPGSGHGRLLGSRWRQALPLFSLFRRQTTPGIIIPASQTRSSPDNLAAGSELRSPDSKAAPTRPPAAEPPTAFHRGGGGGQMPPSEQPAQLPTDDFLMLPVTWIFIT